MPDKPVLVIGAGLGGLSAAIHLAARGQRVVMLEKNPEVGGKMSEIRAQGFRFDTGPSVLTMRPVLEGLFAAAGRRLEDYLTLLPLDPLTRYFYPDGTRLDINRDLPSTLAQIDALEPRDVEGYLGFLRYAARIHRVTSEVFIYGPPPSLGAFTRVSPFEYLHADPFRNMQAAIEAHVRSPHLRRLLGRFATYVGASPFLAPATLNVITHVELSGGVWYPHGGMYSVARAYERLARELGVEIRTQTPVSRITLADGRVTGALAGGDHFRAAAVIANLDVAAVYGRLLASEPRFARQAVGLEQREPSCSGFILLMGVGASHPELAHHNIFFSGDYRAEFEDLFSRDLPPGEPTVYAAITSKSDPDHAPPGKENWFVLVNVPAAGPRWDWRTRAGEYRDLVLDRLATCGYDLRPHLVLSRTLTPLDIESRTGALRGALYGASSNQRLAAFLRPHNRAPSPRGLYFAGGSAHPGGGVPMVTLSGKVAAGMALEDLYGAA